jgi:carboxypeptidase family protein/TonB-dependent receptor-like protein
MEERVMNHYPESFAVRCCLLIAFLLVTAHCLLLTARAQSATATLSGSVVDANNAVVPGASVTITNPSTGLQRHATTDEQGHFDIPLLPPSGYTVSVERQGFAPAEVRDVILNVGDQKALRIQLNAGTITEMVQITGDAPLVNESPAVSTVVDRKFVENLPLNGRGFNALLELTPGVTLTKTSAGNQGQFSVNGQRASSNYFSIDGVGANTGVTPGVSLGQSAAGTLPATSILGGLNALVSEDALQEFRVQTSSFAPEYGRTPGAQISIATRSGTNDFHGAAFDYLRNDKLNANDWFGNSRGLARPIERHNDFGGVIGGPILLPRFGEGGKQPGYNGRNRTFFFFSYEGVRLLQPQTKTGYNVPSLAARQAAPASIQSYLNAFPLPNGSVLANGVAEFNATYSDPANLDSTSLRIDHSFKSTNLFFRFADAPSSTRTRGAASVYTLSVINESALATRAFTAGATSMLSTRITNDFRVNWTSSSGSAVILLDDFGGARVPADSLLFPSYASKENTLMIFQITGNFTTLIAGKNALNYQKQVNLIDTLSLTQGNHSFRFGGDVRVLHPISGPRAYDVQVAFNGGVGNPANSTQPAGTVLSGIASSGTITARTPNFGIRYINVSSFFQDTWRASRRLTFTYGARYDVAPPPIGVDGKTLYAAANVDDLPNLAFAPAGTPLWKTAFGNIAPRIGLAYSFRSRPRSPLVLRVGAGIFYDLTGGLLSSQAALVPNANSRNLGAVPFPYSPQTSIAPVLPAAPPYSGVIVVDPNLKTPRVYQWNVAVEQGLGTASSVSATYVGAQGRRLARNEVLNNANANFLNVNLTRSDATSDYHALQLQFRGKVGSYLQALASYSWSHSIDAVSVDTVNTVPAIRADPKLSRGSSDFDVRHLFTSALTFTVPKVESTPLSFLLRNWSFDAILRTRTAYPVDVTLTRNLGFGNFAFRPDIITGQAIYVNDSSAGGGRRIDNTRPTGIPNQVGPFLIPTTLRQGNLGRNVIRGFSMYQADVDIRREVFLTERLRVQLKAEFFNVTNHPNFGDPNGALGSATATGVPTVSAAFGRSATMLGRSLGAGGATGGLSPLYQVGGPRSVQLSMKLIF